MTADKELIVTATEFKQNLGKYMKAVESSNDVVITKSGRKIARFTPYVIDIERYIAIREKALGYGFHGKNASYEEYAAISARSDLRMEFIDGKIYIVLPPGITHQKILARLHLIFHDFFKADACDVFFSPFAVHFWKEGFSVPDVCQPDLLVICDLGENTTENDRYFGTPSLVLEILSRTTSSKDMTVKLNTYMLSGVDEYWIVDPRQENIIVYRFENKRIVSYRAYERGDSACSINWPGLEVALKSIFG